MIKYILKVLKTKALSLPAMPCGDNVFACVGVVVAAMLVVLPASASADYFSAEAFPDSVAQYDTVNARLGTDFAQSDIAFRHFRHYFSLEVSEAYVPATSCFFRGVNQDLKDVTSAYTVHLKYAFSFPENSRQWRHYPGAYQGLGVSCAGFHSEGILGHPVSLYVFQGAPIARLSQRLTLGYEWNFGASFGWKEDTDDFISIVGSDINAYINLGLKFGYQVSPLWRLTAAIEGTHYSNGNTHMPNSGVNTLGLRVGGTYTVGNGDAADTRSSRGYNKSNEFKSGLSYDIVIYGATRSKVIYESGDVLPGSFGIAGLSFAPMYDFHRLFRAGVSLDFQYDESGDIAKYEIENLDHKYIRPDFYKCISGGISARAEFVMPIFSVAVGVGHNFIGPSEYRRLYQTLTLKTYVTSRMFLNIGYQLHDFSKPNNLMLGLGYRF